VLACFYQPFGDIIVITKQHCGDSASIEGEIVCVCMT